MEAHDGQSRLECAVRQYVTAGPFGIFFTNRNKEMNLPGHSHFAEVWLKFEHKGTGFPVFHDTTEPIAAALQQLTARPIDGTNEEVARHIFAAFDGWTCAEVQKYGSAPWRLHSVRLEVQGVRDKIGHSYSRGVYEVQRAG
jgi:hypothetical protein